MRTVKVKSSAIDHVGYDKKTRTLRVSFAHGAEYDYTDVPEGEFKRLVSAPSVGRYYNMYIKKYTVNKV